MKNSLSRRRFLKASGAIACALAVPAALTFPIPARAAGQERLVAYFSWSGNTRSIAKRIHARVGGDLFEIVPAEAYPSDYDACVEQARKEQRAKARPALASSVGDMGKYGVMFLGVPNWWSSIPMPVATFLEGHDFSGMVIVPFVSHGGGGEARCVADMRKACPGARVLEPLVVRSAGGSSLSRDMDAWLGRLGV